MHQEKATVNEFYIVAGLGDGNENLDRWRLRGGALGLVWKWLSFRVGFGMVEDGVIWRYCYLKASKRHMFGCIKLIDFGAVSAFLKYSCY
jgi:hypothetical protein